MPNPSVDIPISALTVNFTLQMRADGIDPDTRAEYAQILQAEGWIFPPVVVFRDGDDIHLADGFHRYAAALDIQMPEIPADVREGNRRDALLFSCGANAAHGRRRSNADKRRAISVLLDDQEWGQSSSKWIASQVGCDDHTVARVRLERESAARRGEDVSSAKSPSTSEFRSENPQNVDDLSAWDWGTHSENPQSVDVRDPAIPQVRKCQDGREMDTTRIGRPPASDAPSQENPPSHPENPHPQNHTRINPAVICENQKMIIAAALARIREHQAAMHHSDILPLCAMLLDAARHYAAALPAEERARFSGLGSIEGDSDEQA